MTLNELIDALINARFTGTPGDSEVWLLTCCDANRLTRVSTDDGTIDLLGEV